MLHYGNGEELYWDPAHEEVRFSVPNDRGALLCRLEAAALRRYGADPVDPDSCIAQARAHFDHFTHRISDKLALGLVEPDGSVLVRAKDW